MGRAKEALPIGDTTMLGWQCRTLLGCCDDVVVVARDAAQALPPVPAAVHLATDLEPDEGPLGAVAAGLAFVRDRLGYRDQDAAIVTGCDQPFLTAATVTFLRERLGDGLLAMPRANGKLQPLTAIYRVAVQPAALRLLAAGRRRPRELATEIGDAVVIEECALRRHDPELRCLRNVNRHEDYLAARRELE